MPLSTREAADALNTTPKLLRQFLRQDDTFGGVGSGARYSIEEANVPALKARFTKWAEGKTNVWPIDKAADTDGDPGLPAAILRRRDKASRELIAKRAEERVNRLEALLREKGLHISQIKVRETFRD